MTKVVEPSITESAFSCPHCGAYTTQHWYELRANKVSEDRKKPLIPKADTKSRIEDSRDLEPSVKKELSQWIDAIATGLVFLKSRDSMTMYSSVENLHLSICYNCGKTAVWIHERLVFPSYKTASGPNPELPDDVIRDFEEARGIVDASPRGAAALLRLCIQKLCKYLGQSGKDLDRDIKVLVANGLDPVVQQSLDIVRVIGNESVHPGVIDLNDDRDSAIRLFDLVNAIAEQMISHPKKVREMYEKLPEGKRQAIERRDKGSSTPQKFA